MRVHARLTRQARRVPLHPCACRRSAHPSWWGFIHTRAQSRRGNECAVQVRKIDGLFEIVRCEWARGWRRSCWSVQQAPHFPRHPEALALLREPRRMNGPRRCRLLPLAATSGPSPFEARRRRRAPQGDGESLAAAASKRSDEAGRRECQRQWPCFPKVSSAVRYAEPPLPTSSCRGAYRANGRGRRARADRRQAMIARRK